MPIRESVVQVERWSGGKHPTLSVITRQLKKEGLRPYMWFNDPNHRYPVRSHGYDKVLYVVEGDLEITLPDANKRVRLRSGDRLEIPASVRHGTIVGKGGVKCVEAALNRR